MSKHLNTPGNSSYGKDKDFILQFIRNQVENGTGIVLKQLIAENSEKSLYYTALQYVTTTNKALCEAMYIPVEAGCRYKEMLEESGYLISSTDEFDCPFTRHKAHLLSTNPKEFEKLQKSMDTQLKLF